MSYRCSACKRSFDEPGFCPFDGTQLAETSTPTAETVQETPLGESPTEDTAHKLRAISAHEGHADAVAQVRKRANEYDRLIGQTLDGRYLVQRKLGEGGMGVVFAVKHTVIERPLAIKVLKKNVMRDSATIQRFVQEAKAASRIGHPNIVDVTDFGKTPDGMTYSVMEYVDGTTLKATIKDDAPLPPERAIRIASQIARALAAAHGKGIVHRDLKPENVFLTQRDGRPDFVKIVDFGIAKVQPIEGTSEGPRLTRAGAVFGTPEYMSPEQASGRGDTDHRVDVYALGTILYEMLVAKTPHKGENSIRTIAMQLLDPVVPPTKVRPDLAIPKALEAIAMKALEKKRDDRYATMNDMLAALEQVGANLAEPELAGSLPALPPGADPDAIAGPPRRSKPATRPLHEPEFVAPGAPVSFSHVYDEVPEPERRSRLPIVLAGILMLVLGAGGAIFIVMQLQKDDSPQAAQAPRDAAVVAELRDAEAPAPPVDALAVVELPPDAGTQVATTSRRDAGVGTVRPNPNRTVTIEVLTRPGDAEVFIGRNFRGPSGVRITERYGAQVKIECKTDRMKGSVQVVFDGRLSAIMCTATRDRFCVPGLKNPYDDCEEDPNGP